MTEAQRKYEEAIANFERLSSNCFTPKYKINAAQVEIVRAEKAKKEAKKNV